MSYDDDSLDDLTPWVYNKATPGWTEGQLHVRSMMVDEKYSNYGLTIMAVKPGDMQAFIAVDDFVLHPGEYCETKPHDAVNEATTTSAPCTNGQFTCGDGSCVPSFKVCDFVYDCDDSTDENTCPSYEDFEVCSTPQDCYWDVLDAEGLEWVIGTGSEIKTRNSTNGPYGDINNDEYNHFLWVNPGPESKQGFTQIAGPKYQNSASECYFTFFAYLNDWVPPNHPKLIPLISHTELGTLSPLDEINLSFLTPGVWEKVEIGIGRHRDEFTLLFSIQNDEDKAMRAGVAVDTINFFGCAPPPPQDECQLSSQFHCEVTRGCVPVTKLCDMQDDCGDNSDEVQQCETFKRFDFEDPASPFGFFTQTDEGDAFQWGNFNGTSGYRGTGPAFDHTHFNPHGHYLMIPSELGLPGDFARLTTPMMGKSNRDCVLRFFSHMHGHGLGNLTVYMKTSDGAMDNLHQVNGMEQMDVNKWKRNEVGLLSDIEYQVVIEATVGSPGDSDIAIDDVSFTPECRYEILLNKKILKKHI